MIHAVPPQVSSTTGSKNGRAEGDAIYRIAERLDDVESSLRTVYEAYRRRGLIASNLAGMRVMPYHLLPSTEILVAKIGGRVSCTTTLVYDSDSGLPMESVYGEEVMQRRQRGLALAEVSCLADDPDVKTPLAVLVRLMALNAQCARHRGMDELLIAVHPHHADFYAGFFGLEPFGELRSHPAVQGNPAIPLALDIHALQGKHPRAYQRAFEPPFSEEILRPRPLPQDIREYLAFLLEISGQASPCCPTQSETQSAVFV